MGGAIFNQDELTIASSALTNNWALGGRGGNANVIGINGGAGGGIVVDGDSFIGSLYVASIDINGDGFADMITRADPNLEPLEDRCLLNGDTDDFLVARYNLDGSIDDSFPSDGTATIEFGSLNNPLDDRA